MAKTGPVDMIFDIVRIAIAFVVGFIIIKALLQVVFKS